MEKTITRRAAIVGALVSSAAFAVPAVAAVSGRSVGAVALAIADHRQKQQAASGAYDALDAAEVRLRDAMGGTLDCRVQVGQLVGGGTDGSPTPLYAHTHAEIDAHCEQWIAPLAGWGERQIAGYRAKFAEKHADLAAQIERRAQLRRETGYDAASALAGECADAADLAAVHLIVTLPVSAEEADAKRAYLAEQDLAAHDLQGLILAACVEIQP